MTRQEFLEDINLKDKYTVGDNDSYVVDLNSSDGFGRMFNILDRSDNFTQYEDNQLLTEQGVSLVFIAEDNTFMVNLLGDWDSDIYQMVITNL